MGKRRPKRRFNWNVLCPVMWGITLWCGIASAGHVENFFQIKSEIRARRKEAEALTAQLESLEDARQNLDNPDYLSYYAPGKYFVTQSGAQVFKFPKLDLETQDD